MWNWVILFALLAASCGTHVREPERAERGGVPMTVCAGCHAAIYRSYQRTGMARAFARASAKVMPPAGEFRHAASERIYQLSEREGRWFLRRHQSASDGGEQNVLEAEVHYVMGSGNHARTFLHRTADGRLMEMPVGWYQERGGFLAMSPGYDRWDHPGFGRAIPDECMFCHNGYPQLPPGSRDHGAEATFPDRLPEGIDCARCHGPGRAHVQAAGAKRPVAEVRAAIVNPRRLPADRQIEVCLQCHLESTSRSLPYAVVRFNRAPYSFQPGEPLANWVLHFDYAPGRGPRDHFEIAHAGYRMMKSQCYQRSAGRMGCITCHDPHRPAADPEQMAKVDTACRNCHSGVHGGAPERREACGSCHMPKRRTDDVVHVSMTDHWISVPAPGGSDLMANRKETQEDVTNRYRGPVAPLRPAELAPDDPYLGVAQVYSGSNLASGAARLEEVLRSTSRTEPEFYHQLAEAYFRLGRDSDAARWYRVALEKDPRYLPAIRNLGATLTRLGRPAEAAEFLRKAPEDGAALTNLGEALLEAADLPGATVALRSAVAKLPMAAESRNHLGRALSRAGDTTGAEAAWREALRIRPDHSDARANLALALTNAGSWREAEREFEIAIRDPAGARARLSYGTVLAERGDTAKAEKLLLSAVKINPRIPDAHLNLGNLAMLRGDPRLALDHFRRAASAGLPADRARLGMAAAMLELGMMTEAVAEFRSLAETGSPEFQQVARRALSDLGQ